MESFAISIASVVVVRTLINKFAGTLANLRLRAPFKCGAEIPLISAILLDKKTEEKASLTWYATPC